jgi:hypothetical protein
MEGVPVVMTDDTWDSIMGLHDWDRDAVVELLVGLVASEPPAIGMSEDSWGRFNKHVGSAS